MKLDKSKNNIIKKFLGILLIIVIYIPLYLFLFEYIDCRSLIYFYLVFISVFILKIILYIFKFKNKLIVISFAGDIMLSSKILERALTYENKYLVSFSFFGFLFCAILALYVKYVEDGKS